MSNSRWVYIFGMENESDSFGALMCEVTGLIPPSLYKIGTTTNPARRWQQVQVHSPWELRVYAIIRGGFELEAMIHKSLEAYRTRGEWFSIPPSVMQKALEELEDYSHVGLERFSDLPWSENCVGGEA